MRLVALQIVALQIVGLQIVGAAAFLPPFISRFIKS